MATEAKMGMFIVVILVCAFGFLVYHKFDMKQRALLQASMQPAGESDDKSFQNAIEQQSESFNEFHRQGGATEEPTEFAKAGLHEPLRDEHANAFGADTEPADRNGVPGGTDISESSERTLQPSAPTETFPSELIAKADPVTQEEDPFAVLASQIAARKSASEKSVAKVASQSEPFKPFDGGGSDSGNAVVAKPAAPDLAFVAEPRDSALNSKTLDSNSTPLFPAGDDGKVLPSASADGSSPFSPFDNPENLAETSVAPARAPLFDSIDKNELQPVGGPQARPVSGSNTDDEFSPSPNDVFPFERSTEPAVADNNLEQQRAAAAERLFPVGQLDEPVFTEPEFGGPNANALVPVHEEESQQQLLAMLEPRQDVNLFQDDFAPPGKSPQSFPVAAEPSMPVLRKQNDAGSSAGLFPEETAQTPPGNSIQTDAVPKPHAPNAARPKVVQPPVTGSGFFNEPIAPENRPRQFDTSSPAARRPYEEQAASTRSTTTVKRGVNHTNQWEPDVGVARFVPGSQIQQVAGTEEQCDVCEVRLNDTYWTISKRAYGTAKYFSSLALYNQHRISDPKKLRPGMKVLIPSPVVLEDRYPEFFKDSQPKESKPSGYFLQPDGTPAYRVGENETLSEISQKHLGRASRWIQIYQMNRQSLKDPNRLKLGTVIALPDDATDVHLAP